MSGGSDNSLDASSELGTGVREDRSDSARSGKVCTGVVHRVSGAVEEGNLVERLDCGSGSFAGWEDVDSSITSTTRPSGATTS